MKKIRKGILKRIHINQHNLRANKKDGGNRPVVTVKTYNENIIGRGLSVSGTMKIINRPKKPLKCGATLWIETREEVRVKE